MCTCIVVSALSGPFAGSLAVGVSRISRAAHIAERLILQSGSYCRAAHIAERLISVQTDMQTDIDMETKMDVDIGV
jgi:hypothetical protein